jgi:hypothetical protein
MSGFILFQTNHGDIWLRPSAIIGVARETTHTTGMRLIDGKVYSVAGTQGRARRAGRECQLSGCLTLALRAPVLPGVCQRDWERSPW